MYLQKSVGQLLVLLVELEKLVAARNAALVAGDSSPAKMYKNLFLEREF